MKNSKNFKILIIAGSDSCGGAGIQADIKTATAHNTYSSTIITALTAQNTKRVEKIINVEKDFLIKQLDTVIKDIKFDAVKIGMLSSDKTIKVITNYFKKNLKHIPLILDPVMVATSGDILLEKKAISSLKNLSRYAYLITPNIDEAEILGNFKIRSLNDMHVVAKKIRSFGCKNILIKGGHLKNSGNKIFNLLLDENNNYHLFTNRKIKTSNIHGTGCSLSSAIACNIANGMNILSAIKKANRYIYNSIKNSIQIGSGSLVLQHWR